MMIEDGAIILTQAYHYFFSADCTNLHLTDWRGIGEIRAKDADRSQILAELNEGISDARPV